MDCLMEVVVVIGFCLENVMLVEKGKRRLRSLFWRVRAELKRQQKARARSKKRFSFNYDPLSYALNFDDGDCGFLC
ncbi:hypothetical protein QJS10_CPB11g02337 [Acorus calamus]|uniref:Uncharacterized protein n=1 Tax=Acorus calamus TaxID=4465 RepID=A0AAV9DUL0_ACOCL|nr:hypothetical protein QJS10_CPB11g02337 [Acorus calamus]